MILLVVVMACAPAEPRPPADEASHPSPDEGAPASDTLALDPPEVRFEENGLRFEVQRWRWREEAGFAWRARLPRSAALDIVPSEAVASFEALIPADAGPWVAIDGGFYDGSGRAMGLVVSDGEVVVERSARGGSGILEAGPDGPRVVARDAWVPGAGEALQSIDRLVDQGASLVKAPVDARSAARSAVAIAQDAVWVVALASDASVAEADGGVQLSDTVNRGLPLAVFADYLVQTTGAAQALNLDGAVSTQLAVRAGDHAFSVRGERGTINAVVLRPRAP